MNIHTVHLIFFYNNVVQAKIIDGITDMLENETLPSVFTCQAEGEPVPTICWYFNKIMINISDVKYNVFTSVNGTKVTSVFTIVSTQSSDVGTYTCNASNVIGSDRSSGILTVTSKFL